MPQPKYHTTCLACHAQTQVPLGYHRKQLKQKRQALNKNITQAKRYLTRQHCTAFKSHVLNTSLLHMQNGELPIQCIFAVVQALNLIHSAWQFCYWQFWNLYIICLMQPPLQYMGTACVCLLSVPLNAVHLKNIPIQENCSGINLSQPCSANVMARIHNRPLHKIPCTLPCGLCNAMNGALYSSKKLLNHS